MVWSASREQRQSWSLGYPSHEVTMEVRRGCGAERFDELLTSTVAAAEAVPMKALVCLLFTSVASGNLSVARHLLENSKHVVQPLVKDPSKRKRSLLHIAVAFRRYGLLEYLLGIGPTMPDRLISYGDLHELLHCRDSRGHTALEIAVRHGDFYASSLISSKFHMWDCEESQKVWMSCSRAMGNTEGDKQRWVRLGLESDVRYGLIFRMLFHVKDLQELKESLSRWVHPTTTGFCGLSLRKWRLTGGLLAWS